VGGTKGNRPPYPNLRIFSHRIDARELRARHQRPGGADRIGKVGWLPGWLTPFGQARLYGWKRIGDRIDKRGDETVACRLFFLGGISLRSGSSETSPSGPGRPLGRRALTILPVRMGFRVIEGALAALTDANSMARIGAPDPFSNGVLIRNERILISADALIAWVHRSDAHGVVTGRPIRSWEDLWDWRLRP
jgi:hypothetical protein